MIAGHFAAVFVTLFVAHQFADHWVQTDRQAARKGLPGWPGRRACAAHVITYTAFQVLCLLLLFHELGWDDDQRNWAGVALGVAFSAITHYIADRRDPLQALAEAWGHAQFWALGKPRPGRDDNPSLGTGAYALDQSWHYLCLFGSALLIA